jgi:hypothetical protein
MLAPGGVASPALHAQDPDLPLTGGCLCGAVRYAVDAPLEVAYYCHCTRCQHRTGTGGAPSARVKPGSFRITQGEDSVDTYWPEQGFGKAFCSTCGSALWSVSPDDPDLIGVRMGTFDSDPGVRPSYRQFVAYAAPWEPIPDDGTERFPEAATH